MSGLRALCFLLGVFMLVSHIESLSDNDGNDIEDSHEATDSADDEADDEDINSVFTEEQISSDQIRNMHKKIDSNADGKVSLEEMMAFSKVARQDIVSKEGGMLFENMDANKDGKISLEELLESNFGVPFPEGEAPTPDAEQAAEDERIKKEKELEKEKFKVADKNGDGFLDKDELPATFYPEVHDGVLAVTAAAALKEKDKDGDGQLSPDEMWEHIEGENEDIIAEQQADFEKLDLDKNGKLNLDEFKRWESGHFHTHDAMTQLFEVADEDGDKHITASELDKARPVIANSLATSHFVEWAEHYEL